MSSKTGSIKRTPDEPTLDGTDLNWLIDHWLDQLRTEVDQITIDGYRTNIERFKEWWTQHGPTYQWLITKRTFKQFEYNLRGTATGDDAQYNILNKRSGQPLAFHSRQCTMRRLQQMFIWAKENGYTDGNYNDWVPTAEGTPPDRNPASLYQLDKLHKAVSQAEWPSRAAAAIVLTYDVGLRRGECVNLQIEEVQFFAGGAGVANVTGKRTKANATGKRQVAFDAAVGSVLQAYLDELNETSGPFFRHIRNTNRPLEERGLYNDVKAVIRAAGLEEVLIACHDGRRNYITHQMAENKDPLYHDMVRRNVGHASLKQTQDYNMNDEMLDATDMVERLKSPLSKILESKS